MSEHDPEARAVRCYSLLLRLYPKHYRDAFGAQMLRTFRDQYHDARAHQGSVGVAFWLAVVGDEAKNITKEQTMALRARHILSTLLLIGATLLMASSFFWMPGYILSIKIPLSLLLLIGFVAQRSLQTRTTTQNGVGHIWLRQGLRYGGVLGLLWVGLNLADQLSTNDSSVRNAAKLLDVGILLLGMPILFGLAGIISGRRSRTIKGGTLAGLLAAVVGAASMALSLVVIMLLFWDTVRSSAFQSAEMIRAWHASGDRSFSHYLWGDNLSGALAMTIVSLLFGALLGTLGGVLGAAAGRRADVTR